MKAIERIYQYINHKQIKFAEFERINNLSNGYIKKMYQRKADIGETILLQIIENSPDLSLTWLLTGEGAMLKSSSLPALSPIPAQTDNQAKKATDNSTEVEILLKKIEELIRENVKLEIELNDLKKNAKQSVCVNPRSVCEERGRLVAEPSVEYSKK